jgi:ribose-phosphate pyrophosphokinase
MVNAINLAKKLGARDIYVNFVHPVFSANAAERLAEAPAKLYITTDTIEIPEKSRNLLGDRLMILSISELLGEVIHRANAGISVGMMFNE